MKKNETLTFHRNKPVELGKWFDYLQYSGSENGMLSFFYKNCKIYIPSDRKILDINKHRFEVERVSEDSITLKYLGLRPPKYL